MYENTNKKHDFVQLFATCTTKVLYIMTIRHIIDTFTSFNVCYFMLQFYVFNIFILSSLMSLDIRVMTQVYKLHAILVTNNFTLYYME